MAKVQKYSEEKLSDAVVKYSAVCRSKIKLTELAEWASKNIDGLEGVQDRHFARPVQKKDPNTGKTVQAPKHCMVLIDQYNRSRSTMTAINANPLLRSAEVDKFLTLPVHMQRQAIMDTREHVSRLVDENRTLRTTNDVLKAENDSISAQVESLSQMLETLQRDHEQLLVLTRRTMKSFDEQERKQMLASIGVQDEYFDLNIYVASLSQRIEDAFSIEKAIKGHRAQNDSVTVECLMNGIDF